MSQIKRLVFKSCLGIEELSFNPKKINIISGGNEKGKTSILEIIEKALYNVKRRAKFVRTGAEKAYIELETDDGLNIQRIVKEDEAGLDKGSVKVSIGDHPKKSPETFLKSLFNEGKQEIFSFNPVDFMQKTDKEQTDILLKLLPIIVTSEDAQKWFNIAPKVNYQKHGLQVLKDLEEWFYTERHDANLRVKQTEDEVEALFKRLPDNYKVDKWEKKSLRGLYAQLHSIQQINREITEASNVLRDNKYQLEYIDNKYTVQRKELNEYKDFKLTKIKDRINQQKQEINDKIKTLEIEKAKLETELKNLETMNLVTKAEAIDKENQAKLEAIESNEARELKEQEERARLANTFIEKNQPMDTVTLINHCEKVEKMKGYIPLAKEAKMLKNRLVKEQEKADNLDNCVRTTRIKPKQLLSKVELPVKGLGINALGNITIDNLPLSNMSTAKQVIVCLDIAKALTKNSILKLICLDKLEHLDEDVRKAFYKQIEKDDGWQYFCTLVDKGELKIQSRG